ncbi:hypothetical protein SAMN05443144_11657 [Fodinibius roseus]|uniref:Uncharacterized protein n=1 Tax=Fodinibius roseus TaxID=1194090 RepID=A0A1M5G2W1_9BACT|nr:hypothetical protein SAMN05443144_11657 [Fodinibius roseus]
MASVEVPGIKSRLHFIFHHCLIKAIFGSSRGTATAENKRCFRFYIHITGNPAH